MSQATGSPWGSGFFRSILNYHQAELCVSVTTLPWPCMSKSHECHDPLALVQLTENNYNSTSWISISHHCKDTFDFLCADFYLICLLYGNKPQTRLKSSPIKKSFKVSLSSWQLLGAQRLRQEICCKNVSSLLSLRHRPKKVNTRHPLNVRI